MFENSIYNPDVLNCLANLSNDEVFTPPTVVNQMLDMLPQELFRSSKTRFLDPVSKSGVFLREIAKRLIEGLAEEIPDLQERVNHICQHQLFGLAITELTSLLSRRSVYCSKSANGKYASCTCFNDPQGNIRYRDMEHTFERGKCKYCGASEEVFGKKVRGNLESHAYEFIHTDKPEKLFPKNMKFDVIIGNPPYQLNDGGGMKTDSATGSAIPIYQLFIQKAMQLNPRYLTMIVPARWYSGGRNLDAFRDQMLNDDRISCLVDFPESKDCFTGVDIAGGVCYFLWEKEHHGECRITNIIGNKTISSSRKLNQYPVFVRYTTASQIIDKVCSKGETMLDAVVYSSKPFGFRSYEEGVKSEFSESVSMLGSKGYSFVAKNEVTTNSDIIDRWKVVMSKASAEHAGQTDKEGRKRIVSRVEVLPPNTICTETYLLLNVFDTEEEAMNMKAYVKSSFFRFLLSTILITQNIAKDKFQFVPLQDFSHPWTDEMLYEKYGLTEDEIAFIESMIRPME